jgi:diguanylate cyclase (GGDEF)-like protein
MSRTKTKKRSLVGDIMMIHITYAIIVYLAAASSLWLMTDWIVENNLEKWAARWTQELNELGMPLYEGDSKPSRFIHIEDYIEKFPEIAYVNYYSLAGKLIFSEGKDSARQQLSLNSQQIALLSNIQDTKKPQIIEQELNDSPYVKTYTPIWIESIPDDGLLDFNLADATVDDITLAGFVELGLDFSPYEKKFISNLIIGSIIILVIFLIILIISKQTIKRAVKPLEALNKPLKSLAEGNTDIYVHPSKHREINAISHALNTTITALRERDATLLRLANHDSLTGLYNRNFFSEKLDQLAATNSTSALLFIDLDHFKYINDTLGHEAGDRMLVQAARWFRHRLRECDTLCRFGGDEFTILIESTTQERVIQLANKLVTTMSDQLIFIDNNQNFQVSCSIGITMIDSDLYTPDEFLSQADLACHEAKRTGRNRFYFYEKLKNETGKMEEDIGWSRRIETALKEDLFILEYQPIINMHTGNSDIYEVLLRMPGEGDQLIPPSAFLPAAHRFGLMVDIDHWVIQHALEALSVLRQTNPALKFAINLSGHVFEEVNLVKIVKENIERYNIPPDALIFEVTEQVAVQHIAEANLLIKKLIALGCEFALDDFGSGFSSFNYLKHLPIHYIKIDGNFIENMTNDKTDQAMVQSMIQIAKTVGKFTIAEYVLDEETMTLLKKLGIDYAQGHFVGKPRRKIA